MVHAEMSSPEFDTFTTMFMDAAVFDVGLMAHTITGPLHRALRTLRDRETLLDPFQQGNTRVFQQLSMFHRNGTFQEEQTKFLVLFEKRVAVLRTLLKHLNDFHRDTAAIRREVFVGMRVANATDGEFHRRPY